MRSEWEITQAIEQHGDTIRRICLIHLKNYADTEDIFQNVFLKYALNSAVFENYEHEKAWFIRVTINACKDLLKSFSRKSTGDGLEIKGWIKALYRAVIDLRDGVNIQISFET